MTGSNLLERIIKAWTRLHSAALIALAALLLAVTFAIASPQAPAQPAGGAPSVVSYQGQVMVEGSPYHGTGYFKFVIIDEIGASHWSNDGSSGDGNEPEEAVELTVSNGLFNVLLGEEMEPLEAAVFDGRTRYLRVWFSIEYDAFTQLSPDRRIAAVPYSLQAEQAEQAANADTLDGKHASELALPSGAMVLSDSANDTTLINAGFTYTDLTVNIDSWTVKAAMPTGRRALAAETVGGVIYAIGGNGNINIYETANEAYDPVTNAWTTKTDMPTGRMFLTASAVDGVIYAIGGQSSGVTYENNNEAYDTVSNTWNSKAAIPTGRNYLTSSAVDGVVYVIGGGSTAQSREDKNEAYDPVGNSWSEKAPMPTGRSSLTSAVVDGVIYVIGGSSTADAYETKNEAYDPVGDSWSTKTAMPTGRHYLAAAVVDGTIYAIGGSYVGTVYGIKNEAYDPVADSWSEKASMTTGRYHLAAAAVDGVIYALGGDTSTIILVTKNEAYTPALYVYVKD